MEETKELPESHWPALPKWPGLRVQGKRVTQEQAAEILVRTDHLSFHSNDRAWNVICADITGVPYDDYSIPLDEFHARLERRAEVLEKLGALGLEYVNNDRIGSSFIYGPHGWCDWHGTIGCDGINVGKWPSVESVLSDWKKIAEAFPFLSLRSQLMSEEAETENSVPLVEFVVESGNAIVVEPGAEIIGAPRGYEGTFDDLLIRGRERGCTERQLREAVELVRRKMGAK